MEPALSHMQVSKLTNIILVYIAYYCTQYRLRDGTEAWEDGRSEIETVRAEGRAGRRLVPGVRSGWGRASRSISTKYHICQQFVVELGRVSVNTDVLLGEASGGAHLLQARKRYQNCGIFWDHSDILDIKCLNVPYIYDRLILMG